MLLRLETVHIYWQFRRRNDIGKINKFPAGELRPVARVGQKRDRALIGVAQRRDPLDARVRIAAQLAAESHRQLPERYQHGESFD